MTSLAQQTTAFKTKEDLAHDLRDWVALAPPTQSFWVKVTEALRGHLQVQNMSIDRIPGQPQMRLVITVSAAEREAYEAFNQVSAVLKEEGYKTIDFKTYTVPNGYQYDHLLNVPVN
jgi:biopolymer transport protein ExbD